MHTDKQLKEFRRSVEMFGQIRPIVVDESSTILAGNGLFETLLSMGHTEADCYVVSGLTEAQKKKLMLADNRVFDLGVDDLAALDALVLELKDDLDIPGFEEDLLRAMVMEADEASAALSEYGTIDPDRAEEIRETGQRYEAREAAAAARAEDCTPPATGEQTQQAEQGGRFVLCPKCGERIWL
jgi:ParB-like chromosome segregation protein Spo0J